MALGETNKKYLKMTFINTAGGSVSQTLNDPLDTLTAEDVLTYMNLVITKNIFNSSGGDLVAIKDIAIVNTTTNDLYDPAVA